MAIQASPGLPTEGSTPISGVGKWWVPPIPGISDRCYDCYSINNEAFCGLRLWVVYFLLFTFSIVFSLALSVDGTQLILGEAMPVHFATSSVLRLGKQRERERTAHLVMGSHRCQARAPSWGGSDRWLEMCLFLVCTHRTAGAPLEPLTSALQSILGGVAGAADPLSCRCPALPTCPRLTLDQVWT